MTTPTNPKTGTTTNLAADDAAREDDAAADDCETDETDETGADDAPPAPTPAATPPPTENTTTWIVRIDGAEHTVAAGTPERQIRETLSMTYPGARDAAITSDSVVIQGQAYKVLVFTKRAGTKGSDGDSLRRRLIMVPAVPIATIRRAGTFSPDLRGNRTIADLLALPTDASGCIVVHPDQEEDSQLCSRLAALPSSTVTVVTVDA